MEKTRKILLTTALGATVLFGSFASATTFTSAFVNDSSSQIIALDGEYETNAKGGGGGKVIQPPL